MSAANEWVIKQMNMGVTFERNCGAASVGEYNRVIKCYQLSWKRKLATIKSLKADISRVSPLSERFEELWVHMQKMEPCYWYEYCDEEKNQLVEWNALALVDTVRIKNADLEDKFFF